MVDQPHTLRRLTTMERPDEHLPSCAPPQQALTTTTDLKVLSFTSGKGGVGRSHIVVNLAYALQRLGAQVMILDADLGLANIDVLLGLAPRFNLQHVLEGQKTLADILVQGPAGMTILPASSGGHDVAHLSEAQRFRLLDALDALQYDFDFLLVDTGAGISANVIYFNIAAQDIVIVVTPEPTSLTDAYALIKILATQYGEKHFKVVMNTVVSAADGKAAFSRLSMVTERFLNISLDYLGFIPYDVAFSRAVRQQQALLELYPSSPAARCLHQLAQRVLDIPGSPHPKGNIQFLWRRLLTGNLQPSSKTLHVVHGESGNSAAKESCNEE